MSYIKTRRKFWERVTFDTFYHRLEKPSQCSHSIRKVTHATVNRNQITRRSRTLTPINLNLTLWAHLQWRWRFKETEKIFLWLLPLILETIWHSQHMQFSCFRMCHCIYGMRATGFNRSMKSIFSSTHTGQWTGKWFLRSLPYFYLPFYFATAERKKCIAQIRREIVKCPLKHFFSFHQKKVFEQLMQFFILQQMQVRREEEEEEDLNRKSRS